MLQTQLGLSTQPSLLKGIRNSKRQYSSTTQTAASVTIVGWFSLKVFFQNN